MSNQNLNQFGELGDRLKTIIDDGVNSQDYQKMTKEIKNTVNDAVNLAVNTAVETGSTAIKNGLDNVFGNGNTNAGMQKEQQKTRTQAFEEKRKQERAAQDADRSQADGKKEMPALYEKMTGVRVKGLLMSVTGGIRGRRHQQQAGEAQTGVAHLLRHCHRHPPVREPAADLPGAGACGSGECAAAGAGTDQRAAALPAGPDAGANCSRCGEYVDRHSLHHDDLFRGTDEHPCRAVRKRGNGRRGAGQKVHFHHAALYVLRDGPRDDHYLRDEFQQLQRHIPAVGRRSGHRSVVHRGQDGSACHLAV